jgi:thiamine biosynthesis protein ThiS
MESDMQIVLNGEHVEIKESVSIAELLTQLGISLERVAVEVNMDIVPKAKYDAHTLAEGDRVEIVHFVGGG